MTVLAVTGGKGGVGKTTLAIQAAMGLAESGASTVLIDASFSHGCVDLHLGLSPLRDLADVLHCRHGLDDVMVEVDDHLSVLPGCTGSPEIADLRPPLAERFIGLVRFLVSRHDHVVIDTGAGLHAAAREPLRLADRILLVLTPDPAAVVGTYSVARALGVMHRDLVPEIVVNQVESLRQGADVHWRLREALREGQGLDVGLACAVPWDPLVMDSVALQSPVRASEGGKGASGAFARLARCLRGASESPTAESAEGCVVPFVRQTATVGAAASSEGSEE
ncbi:MAG: AAA family ATPase [Acidobacteriota bacterium]